MTCPTLAAVHTVPQSPTQNSLSRQSAREEHCRSGVKEGFCGNNAGFEVLGEAPIAANPGEEALYHPTAGMDGEADLIRALADDLDGGPPASVVLILWLSSTAADGLAARPTRSRSRISR